jgi:hypothetical protein
VVWVGLVMGLWGSVSFRVRYLASGQGLSCVQKHGSLEEEIKRMAGFETLSTEGRAVVK